jgi:hypothetical protein
LVAGRADGYDWSEVGGVRRFWTVILAAVGGVMATVPNVVESGSLTHPWLVVGAVAVSTAFGGLIDHGRRRHESIEHRRAQLKQAVIDGCITFDGRRLPQVRDVTDPTVLGVHPAALISTRATHSTGNTRLNSIPSYVERDVDEEFRQLIAAGGFVLLVGDSTAGKSRAAYEAIHALSRFQPGREVLVDKGYGSQVDVCRSVGVTTG